MPINNNIVQAKDLVGEAMFVVEELITIFPHRAPSRLAQVQTLKIITLKAPRNNISYWNESPRTSDKN